MPKRKHSVFDTRKRKQSGQTHVDRQSASNDMIRQWRIVHGVSGLRAHRTRMRLAAHFSSSIMGDTDMSGSSNKRAKVEEARMIPGLGSLEWGAPNSIITTCRYVDTYTLTSTSGVTTSQVFRANGCNDPDYSGAGHQPMFWDQWKAFYDYYTVLGSKITVTFQSRNATNGFAIGLQGSDTPSLSSTLSVWCEQNNGVHTLLGNANTGSKTLTMTYSPEENLGANMKNDQSSLVGTGSDPGSQQAYYFGVLCATEDAATTAIMTILVDIEYTVKFTTLTKNGGS